MYEHRTERLLTRREFALRQLRHLAVAFVIIVVSLVVGAAGYRWTEGMGWLDAVLNASMILSGEGPVTAVGTGAGKVFATVYALYSGVVLLVAVGVIVAPAFHRIIHKLHMDEGDEGRAERERED